jgi:hypothetical protein
MSQFALSKMAIHITGLGRIYRPHRDTFVIKEKMSDSFNDIEFVRIPGMDGNLAAVGWILHHGYMGAIPSETLFRGLRLRVGDIQVGDSNLLEDLFAESRFNGWTVGEIHVLDSRVVPNGRRDHFEQNAHYLNILNHLTPVARDIGQLCRRSSIKRNWLRAFYRHQNLAENKLKFIRQGSVSKIQRTRLLLEAKLSLAEMETIASKEVFREEAKKSLHPSIKRLVSRIAQVIPCKMKTGPLSRMRGPRKRAFEEIFSLIYECSPNEISAKLLIDKILNRIS